MGGDPDAAIAMYDRYLAELPGAPDAEKVRKYIEKLKQRPMPGGVPGPEPGGADPPITETGKEGASKWFERAQTEPLSKCRYSYSCNRATVTLSSRRRT